MAGPRYTLSLDEFIKKIPEFANALKKRVAREVFLAVVNNEGDTPYKTGSYILSHRIGIGSPDTTEIIVKKGAVTADQAKVSVLARQLPRLRKTSIKTEDAIHISNSVGASTGHSWAVNVEYGGWSGGRGPYLIYEKALQKIEPRIPLYVKQVVDSMGLG
jgi:hypothetical protein